MKKSLGDNNLRRSAGEILCQTRNLTVLGFLAFVYAGPALSGSVVAEEAMVAKEFVIVRSTTSFDEATRVARETAAACGLPLNLRGALQKGRGLTFSEERCEESGFDYPCYVARGRYDDGVYVSVEWSSAYSSFAKDRYVVIAASGDQGADEIPKTLAAVQPKFPDSYRKSSKVYMGCIH